MVENNNKQKRKKKTRKKTQITRFLKYAYPAFSRIFMADDA